MHCVSTACAQIRTDMYELCSCYASGLLEEDEDGRLSEWVWVQVPFPCIRQWRDQSRTISICVRADVYVAVLDYIDFVARLGTNGGGRGEWRA